MAQIIGNVKAIEAGEFFVKDGKGNIHQLKVGDSIHEGEYVYGALLNAKDANILVDVMLAGAGDLVISGNGVLQFDASLLKGVFSHHDAVVHVNSVKDALAMAAASDTVAGEDTTDAGETAAGTTVTDTERAGDIFAARTGAVGDVTTSLNQTGPTTLEVTLNKPPLVLLNSIPTVDWVLTEDRVAVVNEGGLSGGNLGGPLSTGGTLNITTGGDTINTVGGVVINGVDVTNGGTLLGMYGDLVVTLSAGVYSWTYTLNDNAPHTGANRTGTADQLARETFSVVVTDDDGDSTSPANLSILINDDGPSITLEGAGVPALTVDESYFETDATVDFSGLFTTVLFGADGPAATDSLVYTLNVNAGDTGLVDTATGQDVVLVMNGSVVEGQNDDGDVVFTVSVDESGNVTLDQQRAVMHDIADVNGDLSEAETLLGGLITLTATATDADGDTSVANADISGSISFLDDGPSIGTPQNLIITNEVGVTAVGVNLDIMAGADKPISLVLTPDVNTVGGVDYAVDNAGRLLTSTVGGVTYNLVYQTALDGSVTAYQYINAMTFGSAIFTLTPDLDTGTYIASYGGGINGILDGVSTIYTLSYDSVANNSGGNVPVIAYQFPDATPLDLSDNLYAVVSANGTNSVNYSVGNGMGVGSGSVINGSEILYIHFTDSAVKSGATLVPGALGIAIENPLTLEEATFTITRFTARDPDTSVWSAYNDGVLVATGSMIATGTGNNSTANVLISSKVVISTITVTDVNPSNGTWSVVNGVVSFVAAAGFTGNASATVKYYFEGYTIGGVTPIHSETIFLAGGESLNLSVFSEVQFTASKGNYAISSMTATVSTETVSVDHIINVGVAVTDTDGDVVTDNFNVTFDADGNLTGGSGSEVLVGGIGNDMIIGGGGDDTLIGNAGNDTLDGGIGNDTASYVNASFGVTVDLAAGTATGDGADTLTSIENVIGSDHNDTITGNSGDNVLNGGDGNDILISNVATIGDVLTGDTGFHSIDGGAGIDTLVLTTGSNINFGVLDSANNPITNVEMIDLSVAGANQLQNISLQDVLDITGKNTGEGATLTIMGDAVDSVTLDETWSSPVLGTGIDNGFDIYSHVGDPTVTLRVETVIGDAI